MQCYNQTHVELSQSDHSNTASDKTFTDRLKTRHWGTEH